MCGQSFDLRTLGLCTASTCCLLATNDVNYLSANILGTMHEAEARPYLLSRHNWDHGRGQNVMMTGKDIFLVSLNSVVLCSVLAFSLMMHPLLAGTRQECSLNVIETVPHHFLHPRPELADFNGGLM